MMYLLLCISYFSLLSGCGSISVSTHAMLLLALYMLNQTPSTTVFDTHRRTPPLFYNFFLYSVILFRNLISNRLVTMINA